MDNPYVSTELPQDESPQIDPVNMLLEAIRSDTPQVKSLLDIVENMNEAKTNQSNLTIGNLIRTCLLHGLDNDETLKLILIEHPEARTSITSISSCRSKMRKSEDPKENCVPTISQIRSRQVFQERT